MSELRLTVEGQIGPADLETLRQGLTEHALPYTGVPGFRPLAALVRGADRRVVAGAVGTTNWNWLAVALVWVDPALRGRGWGSRLMEALEREALARGCTGAHVDTFSFQARGFYEKLGYEVFAELGDYPPGHRRIFLRRRLGQA